MAINLTKTGRSLDVRARMELRSLKRDVASAIDTTWKQGFEWLAEEIVNHAREKVPVQSGLLKAEIIGKARKLYRGAPGEYMASVTTNTKGKLKPAYTEIYFDRKGIRRARRHKARTVLYGYGADVEIGSSIRKYTSTPYIRPALAEAVQMLPNVVQHVAANEARKQALKAEKKLRTQHARMALRMESEGLEQSRFIDLSD